MASFVEARVIYKVATEAEWDAIVLEELIKGEFYVYHAPGDPNTVINIKIGDGVRQPKDLPYMWDVSIRVPFFGAATPSSTPTPSSGSGFWVAAQAGTYTNYGGVVLPSNSIGIITRIGSSYAITATSFDLANYVPLSQRNIANGYAGLDSDADILSSALPILQPSENIFNPIDPLILEDRLLANGGGTTTSTGYITTGYMRVAPGQAYAPFYGTIPGALAGVRYYFYTGTSQGTAIGSAYSTAGSDGFTTAAPSNANYLKMSLPITNRDRNLYTVATSLPSEQKPFGDYLINKDGTPLIPTVQGLNVLKTASGKALIAASIQGQEDIIAPLATTFLNQTANLYSPVAIPSSGITIVKQAYITTAGVYMSSGSPTQQVYRFPVKGGAKYSFYNSVNMTRQTVPLNVSTATGGTINVTAASWSADGYYTAPANATFIRVTTPIDAIYYTVVEGENPPAVFTQYGFTFGSEILIDGASSRPFSTKRWGRLGDSITVQSLYRDAVVAATGLVPAFVDGQNGQVIAQMGTSLTSANISDLDIITVLAGTNDYGHGAATLGDINSPAGVGTIYGSIKLVNQRILALKPNVRIVWFTPFNRGTYSGEPNGYVPNSNGLTIKNIADAMLDCNRWFGIPTYDLLSNSGINSYNLTTHCPDNLHPNQYGGERIGKIMGNFINTLAAF